MYLPFPGQKCALKRLNRMLEPQDAYHLAFMGPEQGTRKNMHGINPELKAEVCAKECDTEMGSLLAETLARNDECRQKPWI